MRSQICGNGIWFHLLSETGGSSKTKDELLLPMRSIWIAFVVSIGLDLYIGETVPGFEWLYFWHAGRVFVTLSILKFASFACFRMKRYPASAELAKARQAFEDLWNRSYSHVRIHCGAGTALSDGRQNTRRNHTSLGARPSSRLSLWPCCLVFINHRSEAEHYC